MAEPTLIVEPQGDVSTDINIISTEVADEWRARLAVRGELDTATVPQLRRVLDDHLRAGRRTLRLDLSAVTFLDSTALSALLEFHHRCLELHGTLLLTRASQPVQRLFRLTRLDSVLLVDHAEFDDGEAGDAQRPAGGIRGSSAGVA